MSKSHKSLVLLGHQSLVRINEKQRNARIRKKQPHDYVTFKHPISFTLLAIIQIHLNIPNTQTGATYMFTTYNIVVHKYCLSSKNSILKTQLLNKLKNV